MKNILYFEEFLNEKHEDAKKFVGGVAAVGVAAGAAAGYGAYRSKVITKQLKD